MWLLLIACSGDDPDTTPGTTTLERLQDYGLAEACLSSSIAHPAESTGGDVPLDSWSFTGTVVDLDSEDWGDHRPISCGTPAKRVVELVDDADGGSWYLGWNLIGADGVQTGIDPAFADGPVTVTGVQQVDGPAAITLIDSTGLAFMIDRGAVSDGMDGSAFPGLGISWGTAFGSATTGDCAQQASQLTLQGDGTASLYAGDEDGLSIDGEPVHVRAYAIYQDPADPSCDARRNFLLYK